MKKGFNENMNKKFKILIADDEKANLDVLIHILRDSYIVYPAKSGEAALKKAAEVSPDLILLDIIMPDMNGFEILKRLKSDDLTKHIPVIFITALSNSEDEKKGLRLGAADYIVKPFNSEIVKVRIKTQLELIKHIRTIEELGMFDEVTGMPNRKNFDNQLTVEWGRAIREKMPISLIMIDVNGLTENLLIETADVINARLKRITDFRARYSDTIFAVILPNTKKDGAVVVIEDIIKSIRELETRKEAKISLNIGISSSEPTNDDPISYFVLQADRNLYKAKTAGTTVFY
ncbi:MAG: response regulator [Oscillospiraceae bacterium]|nr:response regulator [Oscillospiraceae bacterium]